MRSQSNSPVVTFFMLAPLLAIPLLAVFGVPRFHTSKPASATVEKDIVLGETTNEKEITKPNTDKLFEPIEFEPIDTSSSFSQKNLEQNINQTKTVPVIHKPDGLQDWVVKGSAMNSMQRGTGSSPRRDIRKRFEYLGEKKETNHSGHSHSKRDSHEFSSPFSADRADKNNNKQVAFAESSTPRNPFLESGFTSSHEQQPLSEQGIKESNSPLLPQSWKEAVGRLNALGIREFNIQPGLNPNQFYFSCSYTPKNNPRITHRFESNAASPLQAVQHAILQVEEWKRKR